LDCGTEVPLHSRFNPGEQYSVKSSPRDRSQEQNS